MNLHHKINEVLEALGDETLSTDEIVPRLKEFDTTPLSLTNFMNNWMVNRYVSKERLSRSSGASVRIKFKALPWHRSRGGGR